MSRTCYQVRQHLEVAKEEGAWAEGDQFKQNVGFPEGLVDGLGLLGCRGSA